MRPFPPKQTARVAGETLEYVMQGEGAPNLVLISGAGGPIEGWHKVFEPLARTARVFAYNRPGLGGSAKPGMAQAGAHLVESLRALLAAAGISPPHVLVGHSFGGLIANLFARLHPMEVAGVVMLEATAPEDPVAMAAHEHGVQRFLKTALDRLAPPHPFAEVQHVAQTVAELQAAPPFPAIPLAVVTGGAPAMAWATSREALALRARHQLGLAALSPLGRQVLASRSGHFPQFSEPELVVQAVREVAEAAQRPRPPARA